MYDLLKPSIIWKIW